MSAIFGAPGGSATIRVDPGSGLGIYLPLPQTYGFNTYVGGAPVTLFVEPGRAPTVNLGGVNVGSASISAQIAVVGHLVNLP